MKTRILFVCTGNICRSPAAQGAFEARVAAAGLTGRFEADSAGTIAFHAGQPPDSRMQEAAALRGIDLSAQRARQVTASDFAGFDLILAMDRGHFEDLRARCPGKYADRVRMYLAFAPNADMQDVPDPYYGGVGGFEIVLDLVEAASDGLLAALRDGAARGSAA